MLHAGRTKIGSWQNDHWNFGYSFSRLHRRIRLVQRHQRLQRQKESDNKASKRSRTKHWRRSVIAKENRWILVVIAVLIIIYTGYFYKYGFPSQRRLTQERREARQKIKQQEKASSQPSEIVTKRRQGKLAVGRSL